MISIVVRSHNDAAIIGRTLDGIFRQNRRDFEVLSLDDHSDDGTRELLLADPRLRHIAPEAGSYVPGRVLNRAVQAATGEIVVFNNSDAVPLDAVWLESLVAPLLHNPAVGATFARQECRADAWPLVIKDYERAFGDGHIAAKWKHFFSLVSSAARREVLLAQPFDEELQYSEDVEWSRRLRLLGFHLVYVPAARVEHSHNYTPQQVSKRFYQEGLAEAKIFGNVPKFRHFLLHTLVECARDLRWLIRHGHWRSIASGVRYRLNQRYNAYRGVRDGQRDSVS